MSAEWIYRLLLRAYPPAFRAEYEREMILLFRDQCRDGDVRTLGFWVRVVWDILRSAPALRVETRTVEVKMKIAAIVTVLLGALGLLGAVSEWSAASRHVMGTTYVLSMVLGVAATVLLLVAAIAVLRGMRQPARLALVAAVACAVAARLLFPWMGVLEQLIVIGLPVALLVALYWPRRPSPLGAA